MSDLLHSDPEGVAELESQALLDDAEATVSRGNVNFSSRRRRGHLALVVAAGLGYLCFYIFYLVNRSPGGQTGNLAIVDETRIADLWAGRGFMVKKDSNRSAKSPGTYYPASNTCPDKQLRATPEPKFGAPQPSPGCFATVDASFVDCVGGESLAHTKIDVFDEGLGKTVVREFYYQVPEAACHKSSLDSVPLLFWFHGQKVPNYLPEDRFGDWSGVRTCSYEHNYLVVYPTPLDAKTDSEAAGVSGEDVVDLGPGWNTGANGNSQTCLDYQDTITRGGGGPHHVYGPNGIENVVPAKSSCYSSCRLQNQCGACSWSTCVDDLAFVKALLDYFQKRFCIDRSRTYAAGISNGAIFTHFLYQELPNVFAAVNPGFGLPLMGYATGVQSQLLKRVPEISETAMIQFHIPQAMNVAMQGGPALYEGQNWYYTPLEEEMTIWAKLHGCSLDATDVSSWVQESCPTTPTSIKCYEHSNCRTGRRVVYCLDMISPSSHPTQGVWGCLTISFFDQFRRTLPVPSPSEEETEERAAAKAFPQDPLLLYGSLKGNSEDYDPKQVGDDKNSVAGEDDKEEEDVNNPWIQHKQQCPSDWQRGPCEIDDEDMGPEQRSQFGENQISEGCGVPRHQNCKNMTIWTEKIDVWDKDLKIWIQREYVIQVPSHACIPGVNGIYPVLFWFHGQYGTGYNEANNFAQCAGYRKCAFDHGYIMVFPSGLDIYEDAKAVGAVDPMGFENIMGSGWNVGVGGDESTCLKESDVEKDGILLNGWKNATPTTSSCFPSCKLKNQCGRCNWSTCVDDIAFVKAILHLIRQTYCIDMSRLYIGGESNGAMMTHHIYQEMPDVFAGVNPIFGVPLLGYGPGHEGQLLTETVKRGLAETAIIEFHDISDTTIPWEGGVAIDKSWAWYYTPLAEIVSTWARLHQCDLFPTDVTDEVGSHCESFANNITCHEYKNCRTGRAVIFCMYPGHHAYWPRNASFGCASIWFFNKYRRSSPAPLLHLEPLESPALP